MPLQTDIFSAKLAEQYSHFDVANRLLFTGHSHQAWPDVALDGLVESFDAAARLVDTKWDEAFEKLGVLRTYLQRYYDDPQGCYTHDMNTHNLLVRWISALDLRRKPRIVTTDAEFYSLYRQLSRLSEEGVDVVFVPALPVQGFAGRVKEVLNEETSAVMISRVYFDTGLINTELPMVGALCREAGVPLMIDDYHGTNVVPLSLREAGLEDAYVLIGGYKYLQWGEGNCFLRYPAGCGLRPVVTGWFSAFSTLKGARSRGPTVYDDGDMLFAGATFDGVSAYRAAAVVAFFEEYGLTPKVLSKLYREQVAYAKYRFEGLGLDPDRLRLAHGRPVQEGGGFLALRGAKAGVYWQKLKDEGVLTDYRGDILRFGMAPYIVSGQIDAAMEILRQVVEAEG
jgi:kynureninase